MRILHAYNRHRGGGGSDNAWDQTIGIARDRGMDVVEFQRDSKSLGRGWRDKLRAFTAGVYSREAVRSFEALLSDKRPDLVHTHELYPLISPWVIRTAARAGVPVVHTCYDFRMTCPIATHVRDGRPCHRCDAGEHQAVLRNCRGNRAESIAYALRNAVARKFGLFTNHVSQFVVLTEFSRRWLTDTVGIDAGRTNVNPCAIPLPAAATDPAKGGYVAFAGRFVPEKGVEVLLEAARLAGLPVRLAGDAPVHPALRARDDVQCVVTRSRDELDSLYRGARMLVVPSVWYETFGIVAAEAMSHGVPVVASRIGALQDTVEDGVSGLLFEPGNSADLAEKMRWLWEDDALCRRLGGAARERVARVFSEQAHGERLEAIYRRALEQPRTAQARGVATTRDNA